MKYFGRVDHSDPENPAFAWVMTGVGCSFTVTAAGPAPPNGTWPAGYSCEANENYEGENKCFQSSCPAEGIASLQDCADACDAKHSQSAVPSPPLPSLPLSPPHLSPAIN